jgi:hypothetical protein
MSTGDSGSALMPPVGIAPLETGFCRSGHAISGLLRRQSLSIGSDIEEFTGTTRRIALGIIQIDLQGRPPHTGLRYLTTCCGTFSALQK